jgi:hypothetical protein
VEKGLILGRKRLRFALRDNERDKIVTENGTDVDSFPKLWVLKKWVSMRGGGASEAAKIPSCSKNVQRMKN